MNVSVFPIPQSRVLLFDLDKTILDTNYQLTDTRFLDEVKRLTQSGWSLGLSSDSPLESLQNWRTLFDMSGPIIAERGSVVWVPGQGIISVCKHSGVFTRLRQGFIEYLLQNRRPFYYGDVTQVIRNKTSFPGLIEKQLVFVQAYRRCSFNFYCRRISAAGSLEIDNDLTQELHAVAMNLLGQVEFQIMEDFNPEYGILILSPMAVTKRAGTLSLMEILQIPDVGMVGDSANDILGNDITTQYAVGNSTEELTAVADYQSKMPFTEGVVDILSQIR